MSKMIGENIIRSLPSSSVIILRFFNVIGGKTFLIDRIMSSLLSGSIKVYGTDYNTDDGTAVRDYISVFDCIKAINNSITLLETRKKFNKSVEHEPNCFNIGSGIPTSVFQIIDYWKEFKNKDLKVSFTERRKGDPEIIIADNTLAKEYLKWYPSISIKDSIISVN